MKWNYRGFSLFFLLAVSLLTAFGLPHLRTDTTAFSLISRFDPDREAWEHSLREFGTDRPTKIYIRDDALWSPAKLLALEKLHRQLQGLDHVERIDDLFTHRLLRGKGDELTRGAILTSIPQGEKELARILSQAGNDPLVRGELLSPDGRWAVISLTLTEGSVEEGSATNTAATIATVVNANAHGFQEVFTISPQRIAAESHDALIHDCLRLSPAFALLVSFVVLLISRSWTSALIPLATAALALLWTLGIMGWAGIPITVTGALLPPVAISTAFFLGVHTVFVCRQGGQRDRSALGVRSLVKMMGLPLCLTVTIMAIGISAFSATGIEAIKEFALAAILAVLANGVVLLMLFPHILSFFSGKESEQKPRAAERLERMVRLAIRSPGSITAFVLFFTACSLYQGARITVDADPTALFRSASPLRSQLTAVQENLAGQQSFRITLSANKEKAFLEPRNIQRLVTIQQFLEKQGAFADNTSLADLLSLANREFHGGSQKYYRPPGKRELVAQYLLLYNRQELAPYVSHDLRQATIVVHYPTTASEELNASIQELKGVIANVAGEEIKGAVSGEGLMANRGAPLLRDAWNRSLLLQGAAVLLLVSLMFVSPFGGVATLVLAALPLTMTAGLMGASQLPLTMGSATAFILSCGFLLHGTIHLFSRYSDLCRTSPDYGQAVLTAVREESAPLATVAIALMTGSSLLSRASFSFVAQMGLATAVGLLAALLVMVLVAPLIMSRIRLVGLYEILRMSIDQGALEQSTLFQGMSRYQIKKAILISELHEFPPGRLLVAQGSIGRSMFLILEGKAEVIHHGGRPAQTQRLATLQPGQVFGEIGYVRENERIADVRAITPVRALRFDYQRMKHDLQFFPFLVAKINFNVCRILGERLAGTVNALDQQEVSAAEEGINRR